MTGSRVITHYLPSLGEASSDSRRFEAGGFAKIWAGLVGPTNTPTVPTALLRDIYHKNVCLALQTHLISISQYMGKIRK